MKKIEKLTPEQEAYLPVFREKYFKSATDGRRIDREKLQLAINDAYAAINKPAPRLVILRSPREAMMAIKLVETFTKADLGDPLTGQLRDQLGVQLRDQLRIRFRNQLFIDQLIHRLGDQLTGQLGDQLRGQLRRDQLWGQLGNHLRVQLWDQLGVQLGVQLRDQLRDQLGVQLRGQLGGQLRGQLEDRLWDQLGGQLLDQKIYNGKYLWGSHDLYWIAWYKFGQHIGVRYTDKQSAHLGIMERIGFQCEWWWPYEGICFVSEKPIETHWDDRVLHNEHGPSVLYEDGFKLYTWRGTAVPEEWIEKKDSLKPEHALTWENVEQRRCAAEVMGWHNVLSHPSLDTKTIHKDEDPQIGELLEVNLPDIGRERFLKVQCGTGRTFALPVPPDVKTALEANAWTWGLEPEMYKPEVRT